MTYANRFARTATRGALVILAAFTGSGCASRVSDEPRDQGLGDGRLGSTFQCVSPSHDSQVKIDEHVAVMALVADALATHHIVESGYWDDPSIWLNGVKPDAESGPTANVVLHATDASAHPLVVTIRTVDAVPIRTLRIDGELDFDPTVDTGLSADTIIVSSHANLNVGTLAAPIAAGHTATITFTDSGPIDRIWDPYAFSRGLISHGNAHVQGQWVTPFVQVLSAASAGSGTLTLASAPVGWSVGDRVTLTGTTPTLAGGTEERTITAVDGAGVTLDAPLMYDHPTPEAELHPYLANLTRNVRFQSASTATARRGHVMFMHSDLVSVQSAGFYNLGRTDKNTPIDDPVVVNGVLLLPGTGQNPRGRYGVHVHRAGIMNPCAPVVIKDSVVDDSPGWGFVNHSSTVVFEDDVAHRVTGSAFATETGNEQGAFHHNLAVKTTGHNGEIEARLAIGDFGYEGRGFWFQGAGGLHITDNVSADHVAAAYTIYASGLNQGGDLGVTQFPSVFLADASWTNGAPYVTVAYAPVPEFARNEGFNSPVGVWAEYELVNSPHTQRWVIDGLQLWNLASYGIGVYLPYTTHVDVTNSLLLGNVASPGGVGSSGTNATSSTSYSNDRVVGFSVGLELPMMGYNYVNGGTYQNEVNFRVPTLGLADRTVDIHGAVASSTIALGGGPYDDLSLAGDLATEWFYFPGLFSPDHVLSSYGPHAGSQVYFVEQAAGFTPFPATTAQSFVPSELLDKTNATILAQYGIALYGANAPSNATTDPAIHGLIGAVATYPPKLTLVSLDQVSLSANYQLVYKDALGHTVTDPVLTRLLLGWNLLTRTIGGQLRSFFVHNSGTADPPVPPPPPPPGCTLIRRGVLGAVLDTQIAHVTTGSSTDSGNAGAGLAINTGAVGSGFRQGLLRFDLGVLPANITLTSAVLSLYARAGYTSNATINLHASLFPWQEMVVTWTSYYQSPAPQYGPTLVSLATTASSWSAPLAWNVTGLVASWLSGASPNYGVLLEQPGTAFTNFYTSEDPTVTVHPSLSVCYTQ